MRRSSTDRIIEGLIVVELKAGGHALPVHQAGATCPDAQFNDCKDDINP